MDEYSVVGNNRSIVYIYEQPRILDDNYVRTGLILVYSLIFLICCLGNVAVILVVTLQWKARPLSRFYLGNLAAANLCVALFCIPQNLTLCLLDRWIFGELMCRLFHFIPSLCHTASILTLVIVSVERYVTIVHSIKGGQVLTTRRLQVMMLLVWALSSGVSFYCGLIRIPVDGKGTMGEICVPKTSNDNSATADIIYFVVLYVLPLAVMWVMYLRIGVRIRKSENRRTVLMESSFRDIADVNHDTGHVDSPHVSSSSKSSSSVVCTLLEQMRVRIRGQLNHKGKILGGSKIMSARRRELRKTFLRVSPGNLFGRPDQRATTSAPGKRFERGRNEDERSRLKLLRVRCQKRQSVIRMLKSIVVTFALLNLPFHVLRLCVIFTPSFDMSSDLNSFIATLTFVLMYTNCAVNPVLYVAMSKRFRLSLRDLIRKLSTAFSRTPVYL